MATTFDDDETSVARSRPIDLFQFETPTASYRNTSHIVDVVYGGNTYTAITMSRGDQQLAQDPTGRELVVTLPITHEIVQRFCASGIPEHSVIITVSRLQANSGAAQQIHSGFAGGISIDGHTALIRLPALTDDAMKIRLPVIAAQKTCVHILYDNQCQVNRITSSGQHSITAMSGKTATTDSAASGDFYVFGDIVHLPTGQRRMIVAQSGAVLTLDAPFVGAIVGDPVRIAPGCAHDIVTCRDKFNNVVNFVGMPNMNGSLRPWAPGGLGIIVQQ